MATDFRANQINKPRIYVDYLQYFNILGRGYNYIDDDNKKTNFMGWKNIEGLYGSRPESVIGLQPHKGGFFNAFGQEDESEKPQGENYWLFDLPFNSDKMFVFDNLNTISSGNCWAGVFGHDLWSASQSNYQKGDNVFKYIDISGEEGYNDVASSYDNAYELVDIVNSNIVFAFDNLGSVISTMSPDANGLSIFKLKNREDITDIRLRRILFRFLAEGSGNSMNFRIGSLGFGIVYDFPMSPDLNVTFSREYDGITNTRSKYTGATNTNVYNSGPPDWGPTSAWEITRETSPYNIGRNGRRAWDVRFSYLTGAQLHPDQELVNHAINTNDQSTIDPNTGEEIPDTLNQNEDWFLNEMPNTSPWSDITSGPVNSNIWEVNNEDTLDMYKMFIHKTMGGNIPFIFQPNTDNNNPDGFAICTIAQDSISLEQVAFNAYNVSFKIEESW